MGLHIWDWLNLRSGGQKLLPHRLQWHGPSGEEQQRHLLATALQPSLY